MRYVYLGDKATRQELVGMLCDPVRRPDDRCIVSVRMASALVKNAAGELFVVARRRLRVREKVDVRRARS